MPCGRRRRDTAFRKALEKSICGLRFMARQARFFVMTCGIVRLFIRWSCPLILAGRMAAVEDKDGALPALAESQRTNGRATLDALKPLAVGVHSCSVEILRRDGGTAARGVQVSADGRP